MLRNLLLSGIPVEKIITAPNCFSMDEQSIRVIRRLTKPEVRHGAAQFLSPLLSPHDCYDPIRSALLSLIAEMQRQRNITGPMAEVGVFQGDFARQMSALFPERKIWLFDTFDSFDTKDMADSDNFISQYYQTFKKTSVEMVLDRMPFRDQCIIRKGYFPETARDVPPDVRFSLVSLDADLYQPILAGLEFFYPRLTSGGVILIHDYNSHAWPGATQAVDEFTQLHSLYPLPVPDNEGSAVIIHP